jgi:GntR family transcriptional regulator, carbon starvation induced regulator
MEIEKGTLTEIALERVRQDIITGAFDAGQNLRIEMLKERYEMGASPLREALARLITEGFVVSEANRGFRVAPMSREDLDDIMLVRQTVEGKAVKLAIEKGSDDWEVGIVAALRRLTLVANKSFNSAEERLLAMDQAHWQFHRAMIHGCGSTRLAELQETFYRQGVRYRRLAFHEITEPTDFVRRHEDLAKILLARDVPAALAALGEHIGLTSEDLFPR